MFHHFDIVTAARPLPGVDVPVGTTGTVIRVFDWTNTPSYHIHFDEWNRGEAFLVRGDDNLALQRSIWQELKGSK